MSRKDFLDELAVELKLPQYARKTPVELKTIFGRKDQDPAPVPEPSNKVSIADNKNWPEVEIGHILDVQARA